LEAAERATQANEKLALKVEEKTRIEGELRAVNERLIAATNAKSQFLANMSHEIRTPMNGVLGMCELLLATSLDNRQHHLARTMRQSASMLLVIINDILDLSRIEAGKVEIESRPFDLDVCLEEVSATLAPTAHGKGLDFGVVIAPDVPRVVTGDAVRMRQILLNLVGNAIKFTGNGEIGVNVELDKPTDAVEKLKIEVRDSGIGISKEQQKHLFENFSQADVSITRKFGGTGLGLAITKQLVNMMGGEIRLKSQLGDGTTITVTLPLTAADSTTSLATNEEALRLQTCDKRVAVLSEVPIRRHAVSSQLQRAGLTTRVFDTSLDFLYAVRKGWQPDIVVIDAEPAGTVREKNLEEALAELPDIQIVMTYAIGKHTLEQHENSSSQGILLSYPTNLDALGHLLDTLGATCRDPLNAIEDADTGNYNPSLSGLAILLAEDNPVNQIIATEFLSDFGCDITVVENGQEVIDALAGRRFDAVLMDCQMPVMDGLAATRNIRASELRDALQPIPIIAVTANAFASDKKECLEAGMDSFLAKPFAQRDLEIALMQGIATRKELNKIISNSAPRQLEPAFI
jgi:CheY-like chemotaxis protein/nitrogen-specific signal transduction histidine kinase